MNENQQVSPDQNLAQAPMPVAPDKLIPQHEVNSLVGGAKQRGYEKGYQQAVSEMQQKQAPQPQVAPAMANVGMDDDRLRKIAADELLKQHQMMQQQAVQEAQRQEGTRILNELGAKFNEAKSRIPDFDKVVDIKDFQSMPEVLHYANMVDNSGDVMYDLAQNPSKIASIRSVPPQFALKQVRQLSDSIKQNQSAVNQPQASAPLSQVKPSNIGVDTSGKPKTAADFRKFYAGKL